MLRSMLGRLRTFWWDEILGQRRIVADLRQIRRHMSSLDAMLRYLDIEALAAADGRHSDPLSLPRHHGRVYSQNGEDGIIAEIFRRIGTRTRTFIEIGIGEGQENNTRFLVEQGWSGVWIEGNPRHAKAAAERYSEVVAAGRLKIVSGYATPDGIDDLLDTVDAPEEVDLLSLDIDQHTTHVWRALHRRARVSCIEYNASLPPSSPLEVPYDAATVWDGTNWFGGGLKAIEIIGAAKGLNLVGCDIFGVNAFLVDARETAGKFRQPFNAETHYQPPRYGRPGHRPANEARVWQNMRIEVRSGPGMVD